MTSSRSAARCLSAGIFFVIAALLLAPPLVRAMRVGAGVPPIRLNRGFEQPPPKADIAPPADVAASAIALPAPPEPSFAGRARVHADELRTYAPPDRAPDPLRGPPVHLLA